MQKENLLKLIQALPDGADIGIQIGRQYTGIDALMIDDEDGALYNLRCNQFDLRDIINEGLTQLFRKDQPRHEQAEHFDAEGHVSRNTPPPSAG